MSGSLFLAAYATVLLAELLGDKTLYTIGALSAHHRLVPVFFGIVPALMGKMLVAVLFGRLVGELPPPLVAGLSALTFAAMAVAILARRPAPAGAPPPPRHWSRSALVAFAAVFFSEWGDVGQLTAATLAARTQAPLGVFAAATLAMITKACLAAALGVGLRRFFPRPAVRYSTAALCALMSLLALLRIDI